MRNIHYFDQTKPILNKPKNAHHKIIINKNILRNYRFINISIIYKGKNFITYFFVRFYKKIKMFILFLNKICLFLFLFIYINDLD